MLQKCPECGRWNATVGENFIERGIKGFSRQVEDCGEIGEGLLGKIGKRIGEAIGLYSSAHRAGYDMIFGYKYQFQCECGHTWGTDNTDSDETEYYEQECHIAELVEKYSEVNLDKNDECEEFEEALQEARESDFNSPTTLAVICDISAAFHFQRAIRTENSEQEPHIEQALNEINISLELCNDDPDSHITKGMILSICDNTSNYDILKEIVYCREIKEHKYFNTKLINMFYEKVCENYERDFLEINQAERKYLVLVSNYVAIPDSFKVLKMSNLPENIKFLGSGILENTLYVLHPLKEDTYIPCDKYSIELFREQLQEYRYIMECLGAKSLKVTDLHTDNNEIARNEKIRITGGGEYKGISANAGYDTSSISEQYKYIYNELSQEIHCELSNKPYIPEDVIWYHHFIDWKRNCESRMAGRILVFRQKMSNKHSTGLTAQNSKKIEGEFNSMIAKINGNYETDNKLSIKEDKEHTWEVAVEFYPLGKYQRKKWWKFW